MKRLIKSILFFPIGSLFPAGVWLNDESAAPPDPNGTSSHLPIL